MVGPVIGGSASRTVVVTESNLSHLVQAIREGRIVLHGVNVVARTDCAVGRVVDFSSPAAIAGSVEAIYFDPCCVLLSLLVSDRGDPPRHATE